MPQASNTLEARKQRLFLIHKFWKIATEVIVVECVSVLHHMHQILNALHHWCVDQLGDEHNQPTDSSHQNFREHNTKTYIVSLPVV